MTALLPRAPLAIVLASLAILGSALASQYWGGLQPCALCMWQRWAYVATIALGVAALATAGRLRAVLIGLAGLAFLAGGGVAVFHVGVEQHWWPGFTECASPISGDMTTEEYEAAILAAPVVRCDQVAWSFAGISMAGYNVFYAIGLGLFAFLLSNPRSPSAEP